MSPPYLRLLPVARRTGALAILATSLGLASCVTYRPLNLSRHDDSVRELASLQIDPGQLSVPELRAHRFDPSDGLDMTEVAMIAVVNNPDLKLARDDLGIARAQAFSAGLLPDPQLSIASDHPSPGGPGLTRAFSYGLSMDVMSLLTRSANVKAADEATRKTDLSLLWQEWQTIAQARQLFVRVVTQDRLTAALQRLVELNQLRNERTSAAVLQGNSTADIESTVLASYRDAQRQAAEAERARNQARHDLNALLGIAPDVHLDLIETAAETTPLDEAALDAALRDLPRRRPDLLALEAGYREQDEKYRAAIMGQFPNLNVGFVRQRDTQDIYASGFQINLSLPVFNRNRGNIAIENATRQRVADEFQHRIRQAYADIDRMRVDQRSFATQLEQNRLAITRLERIAAHAQRAFNTRALPLPAYIDAQSALVTKQIETVNVEQALLEGQIAMNALLGGEMPTRYQHPTPDEETAPH